MFVKDYLTDMIDNKNQEGNKRLFSNLNKNTLLFTVNIYKTRMKDLG